MSQLGKERHTLRCKQQKMRGKPQKSAIPEPLENAQFTLTECYTVAQDFSLPDPFGNCLLARGTGEDAPVDGNLARRANLTPGIYWDRKLIGFGLRVRDSGHKSWIVKYAQRGKPKWVTLGEAGTVEPTIARERAIALLTDAALDGLPRKRKKRAVPLFRDYAPEFLADYAHHWKPSTRCSNRSIIRRRLLPEFGDLGVEQITPEDVARWRDGMADEGGSFNRSLPVLAVMLIYAEQLGYRRKGSNPCKGVSRYKRKLPDRYLSPVEYRRLARTLAEVEEEQPNVVAALRLLMFTGARSGEITRLKWAYVQPPRLMLPDSKTGPKIIYLNSPAMAVLNALPRGELDDWVLPMRDAPHRPVELDQVWIRIRRRAAIPDVRIHDLRHSFASVAIADGVPLHVIGKLLGHALPETTARYAHLADEVIADAADRVCGGLASALELAA